MPKSDVKRGKPTTSGTSRRSTPRQAPEKKTAEKKTQPRTTSSTSAKSATGKKTGVAASRKSREASPPASPPTQSQRRRRSSDPTQRRDPERTRQLILDAASEEFGNAGYSGARVMRIAERAGVAHQLITYHFGGKKGLFDALSDRWEAESKGAIVGTKPAGEAISELVHQAGQFPSWARALVREGQQDLDHARLMERLTPMLENARERQARGEFPSDVDAGIVTLVFFAANTAPTVLPHITRALSPVDPDNPAFLDYYADQLGRLIMHLGKAAKS